MRAASALLLFLGACGGGGTEPVADVPAAPAAPAPTPVTTTTGTTATATTGTTGTTATTTMGADPVGQPAGEWLLDGWLRGDSRTLADVRGGVVLIRFFTNTCPYCATSMPALQRLHERYADEGLIVLGFYHPKPLGADRPRSSVEALLDEWGVTFPVALDTRWRTLRRYWLDAADRRATSASFLIDRDGAVAHVHPGPELHPAGAACNLDAARCASDFTALEAAIEAALGR